jgi:hypothetical protein
LRTSRFPHRLRSFKSPRAATDGHEEAQWARAAEPEPPQASIIGFEIGNEPDLYDGPFWSTMYAPLRRVFGVLLLTEFSARLRRRVRLIRARARDVRATDSARRAGHRESGP